MRKGQRGFTLIELMIAVSVVGLLAGIAVPNFVRYQLKSRTAEARTNIAAIKTGQEAFRASYDFYANLADNGSPAPGPQKEMWQDNACRPSCSRANPFACREFDCIGFVPNGPVYYRYQSHAIPEPMAPKDFCVAAVSDLDGDGNLGGFEYQSANTSVMGQAGNAMAGRGIINCPIIDTPACGQAMPLVDGVTNCAPGVY